MRFFKSTEEKMAEAKLDPDRNARASRGLTAKQIIARQAKVETEKNKRRGR